METSPTNKREDQTACYIRWPRNIGTNKFDFCFYSQGLLLKQAVATIISSWLQYTYQKLLGSWELAYFQFFLLDETCQSVFFLLILPHKSMFWYDTDIQISF